MGSILREERSIIPACDIADLERLKQLVKETCHVDGISSYKIGFELGLKFGIPKVVETIRDITNLPIIYDHQKAATDIPDTGKNFVQAVKGVDAVILFPTMGPETEKAWIKACKNARMAVIVGGEMTHPGYLQKDGGYILDDAPFMMYDIAQQQGITDFVVPGNKPDRIKEYRDFLTGKGVDPVFYSPGLVTQGGDLTESAKAAGDKWHAIVGRGIYQAMDMEKAAKELVAALNQ